jgi:hypothetical protein
MFSICAFKIFKAPDIRFSVFWEISNSSAILYIFFSINLFIKKILLCASLDAIAA